MDKVIVTGGAGFIGSHLVKELMKSYYVIIIDNMSANKGKLPSSKVKNFQFVLADCCDMVPFPYLEDVKTIYHLAANSNISDGDPDIEFHNTMTSTYKMLRLASVLNIPEFIFTSSGSIYGPETIHRTNKHTENDRAAPISHYAAAKAASEAFIHSFANMHGIKSLILRLPNVVGPGMSHGVIYDFINKLKQNPDKLEILGDGNQTKPYMHVNHIITAILYLQTINDNNYCRVFNIAPSNSTMVKDIATMVSQEMGLSPKFEFTGGKGGWPGDVPLYQPQITKLLRTGYINPLTSDQAILRAIKEML